MYEAVYPFGEDPLEAPLCGLVEVDPIIFNVSSYRGLFAPAEHLSWVKNINVLLLHGEHQNVLNM